MARDDAGAGAQMQGGDAASRSEAARQLGSVRTPRKTASSRENVRLAIAARVAKPVSEETRAKLRAAQRARREREAAARAATAAGARTHDTDH
jgi:hypothetical protein